jgi:hypothetical protein
MQVKKVYNNNKSGSQETPLGEHRDLWKRGIQDESGATKID